MKYFLMLVVGVLFSFYYFPISFKILPILNTKMILAVFGVILLVYNLFCSRFKGDIPRYIIVIFAYAFAVSLIAFFSTVYNNTPDYVYATYFISMTVWLSAAYALGELVYRLHGKLSLSIVTNYLIAVCAFQCIMALVLDAAPAIKAFINTYIEHNQDFLDKSNVRRLYGIGAALDTAGIRFSIVLILITHKIASFKGRWELLSYSLYWLLFIFIAIVGNMMARTTTVGMLLAIAYLLLYPLCHSYTFMQTSNNFGSIWKSLGVIMLVVIPVVMILFAENPNFSSKMRFGFEGFFNLVETGEWNVGSNNQLMNMLVFPDTIKTWIIGDGYFNNPNDINPQFYLGEITGGYYMGTDIGYLRFIFYFGILGLSVFTMFFMKLTQLCNRLLMNERPLFIFIFILGMCVWLKVSTDIFVIFALFLIIASKDSASERVC